jgi:hypothetical protein
MRLRGAGGIMRYQNKVSGGEGKGGGGKQGASYSGDLAVCCDGCNMNTVGW